MADPQVFIHEFLFRGRPPAGPGLEIAADWSVQVDAVITDPFDTTQTKLAGARQMTPDQAAGIGLTLPDVLAAINTEALAQVTSLQAQVATLQSLADNSGSAQ